MGQRIADRIPSPTPGLVAGLLVTLLAVVFYAGYAVRQIHVVRELQHSMVDRNRRDSLQLLRIQDNLNSLALAMRDMVDRSEPYALTAWSANFARIRRDLDDAIRVEAGLASGRSPQQTEYLTRSVAQFWDAVDRMFSEAQAGRDDAARDLIRDSLQSRQAALATAVARLLVANNESDQRAAEQITAIYGRVERDAYIFLLAMLCIIVLTSAFLIASNRRLFRKISDLSIQRSELSRKLIATQEETLRGISRELHDEFGQILTAIGVMLRRAGLRASSSGAPPDEGLAEVQQIAQDALEKVRSLSQALQPVILQEEGLFAAVEWYLPVLERQTGIAVRYEGPRRDFAVDSQIAIHVFRVLQEALNNVVRHSGASEVFVRIKETDGGLALEVEDRGKGIAEVRGKRGIGLVAMRERASLIGGKLALEPVSAGGTLVRLTVPVGRTPSSAAGPPAGSSF